MAKQANNHSAAAEESGEQLDERVIVTQQFEDSQNHYQRYDEGQDVTGVFTGNRLATLQERGVVKLIGKPAEAASTTTEDAK